ncbi:polyamine-modulated factor 1-like isoform X2 [Actinia tenebrosa]|uniref:Polyamine-modulated factor 1-like isoform X2 n=1 Tax=Actinia tenebrosa TaxID=6105 RepID=A0A6P8JBV9_ACTTE|nr:polyamine-modulated factor 1-like isoform X2 [Actinia tenebrosa]
MSLCNYLAADKVAEVETSATQEEQEEGKEEKRMIIFRKIMDKCLNKIMSAGRHSQFKNCFKELRTANSGAFDSISEQLMNHLKANIETEISLMIKQEDLEYFFDTLDRAVEENSSRPTPAWRPSGEPSTDCRDHLMAVKSTYRDQLKGMLEKIENENKSLEDVILPQREKVEENQKMLPKKAEHLREAAELCEDFNMSRLQEQAMALVND